MSIPTMSSRRTDSPRLISWFNLAQLFRHLGLIQVATKASLVLLVRSMHPLSATSAKLKTKCIQKTSQFIMSNLCIFCRAASSCPYTVNISHKVLTTMQRRVCQLYVSNQLVKYLTLRGPKCHLILIYCQIQFKGSPSTVKIARGRSQVGYPGLSPKKSGYVRPFMVISRKTYVQFCFMALLSGPRQYLKPFQI